MGGSSAASVREPHQSGVPSNCMSTIRPSTSTPTSLSSSNHEITPGNKWYWVVHGDDCQTIVDKFDITKEQFYALNPATGATCKSLWQNAYVCVGVSGQSLLPLRLHRASKFQIDILTTINRRRLLSLDSSHLRHHSDSNDNVSNGKRHGGKLRNQLPSPIRRQLLVPHQRQIYIPDSAHVHEMEPLRWQCVHAPRGRGLLRGSQGRAADARHHREL